MVWFDVGSAGRDGGPGGLACSALRAPTRLPSARSTTPRSNAPAANGGCSGAWPTPAHPRPASPISQWPSNGLMTTGRGIPRAADTTTPRRPHLSSARCTRRTAVPPGSPGPQTAAMWNRLRTNSTALLLRYRTEDDRPPHDDDRQRASVERPPKLICAMARGWRRAGPPRPGRGGAGGWITARCGGTRPWGWPGCRRWRRPRRGGTRTRSGRVRCSRRRSSRARQARCACRRTGS